MKVTHQVSCLQSSVGRHVLASSGRHGFNRDVILRGETSVEMRMVYTKRNRK
jgi:hypothetical protein